MTKRDILAALMEVIALATSQIIGYLVTGLWTLLNIGIVVAVIAFFVRLYKYLGRSDKTKKETNTTTYSMNSK